MVTKENPDSLAEAYEATLRQDEGAETQGEGSSEIALGKPRLRDRWRGSRALMLGAAFGAGVLLGWLVIGWWLWPVQWTDTDPWDLRPQSQRTFVSLVAESYWRTNDVRRSQDMLAGWDSQALQELLDRMQAESPNPEERQRLVALAEALEIPVSEGAFLSSVFDQKMILVTVALSLLPLVAAIGLGASLLFRKPEPREAVLDLFEDEEELPEEEGVVLPEIRAAAPTEKPEEQKKDEVTVSIAEGIEDDIDVQDLLSTLFDDENEGVQHLEALSKGLEDINIEGLLGKTKEVCEGLHMAPMPR